MSYLMRLDPFRGLTRMPREMDRLMRSFLTPMEPELEEGVRVPSVDMAETEQEIVVKAEMPGISKDQLDIQVLPDMLSLSADLSAEKEEEGRHYRCRERVWGRFQRDIPLPVEVNPEEVRATLEQGVLEVRMPKSERAKAPTPKKVTIA